MNQNNGLSCFSQYPIDINRYQLNHSKDMTNSAPKGKVLQKLMLSMFTDFFFFNQMYGILNDLLQSITF